MKGPRTIVPQLIRYSLVGVANTALTLGLIFAGLHLLSLNEYAANAIGYAAGIASSYFLNSRWTFRVPASISSFGLFLLVAVASYGIQVLCLYILRSLVFVGPDLSQVLAAPFYTLFGFVLNKYFALAPRRRHDESVRDTSLL